VLVREYREITKITSTELEHVWSNIKEYSIIIGGWAAHLLTNNTFKEWKGIDYIGSKDIDLAIRATNLNIVTGRLIRIGYTPLNFRFFKIYHRETKRPLSIEESNKYPIYELFYLFVDLILDQKVKKEATFFSDPLIKFVLDNELWLNIGKFKVIRPEPLLLTKLKIINQREQEKRIKDILDSLFIASLSPLQITLYKELKELYPIPEENRKTALKILRQRQIDLELADLRLTKPEINNLKTALTSLI